MIEFVVQNQQCENCQRAEAKDTWTAVCQVRQRVSHKRTFFWLEQLILRHDAHKTCNNIKSEPDGLDFFFQAQNQAVRFLNFVEAVCPVRWHTSKKLVGQDDNSNTYNFKFTYCIEIVPICREDVVVLPLNLARQHGNINPLLLVTKVANALHFLNPFTLDACEVNADQFWDKPFRSILSASQLTEYTILDIVPIARGRHRTILADVQVARTDDFSHVLNGRTHLGALLRPGDTALGYDLTSLNCNDDDLKPIKDRDLPDFMLVKKYYPRSSRERPWQLKTLEKEDLPMDSDAGDYTQFLETIEEDKEMRSQINLYKKPNAEEIVARNQQVAQDSMDEDNPAFPDVDLAELLDDLSLTDNNQDQV